MLFFGDLFNVEFVSHLLLVDSSTEKEHDSDNANGEHEDGDIVESGVFSVGKTELKYGPPVEGVEEIEQDKHTNDLEPVVKVILVDFLVISVVLGEICAILL